MMENVPLEQMPVLLWKTEVGRESYIRTIGLYGF